MFGMFKKQQHCKEGYSRKGDRCVKREQISKNPKNLNHSGDDEIKGLSCSVSKNKKHKVCKNRPKPMFPYFGGKQRVADKIIQNFPNHDTYVEPFVGGGAVYWANTIPGRYIINDKNKDVYNVYKTAKNNPSKIRSCDVNDISKNKFKKIKNKSRKSGCDIIKLSKHSFGGDPDGYYAEKNKRFKNHFDEKHVNKLKKTTVLNQDYKTVAKRYDKKGVVQYWDPPYVKQGNRYATHGVTAKEVCDTAKSLKKAKIVLSYDNNAEVRNACKKLRHHTITVPYSAKISGVKKKELLITNF